jgi:hypothetical protein
MKTTIWDTLEVECVSKNKTYEEYLAYKEMLKASQPKIPISSDFYKKLQEAHEIDMRNGWMLV